MSPDLVSGHLIARSLLSDAIARGEEAARHWHATSAAERRLNAALLGGEGTDALAAAIREAAAANVKVSHFAVSSCRMMVRPAGRVVQVPCVCCCCSVVTIPSSQVSDVRQCSLPHFMLSDPAASLGFPQVGDARRLLKALHSLEAALPAAGDTSRGGGALAALQSRLEAAELAGVAPHHPLLAAGHAAEKRLALADARHELRLAAEQLARPRGDRYGRQAPVQNLTVGVWLRPGHGYGFGLLHLCRKWVACG